MTAWMFAMAIVAEIFLAAGQLIVKRSMILTNRKPVPRAAFLAIFLPGVAAIAVYFFLWLGLMQHDDLKLSQQYAFDAVAPILLVFAAMIFLKERLTARSWLGIALTIVGLVVISFS